MSELPYPNGTVPFQLGTDFFFGDVGRDKVTGWDKIYYCRSLNEEHIKNEQKKKEEEKNKNIVVENLTDSGEAADQIEEEFDTIYRLLLYASKLLQGRVTIGQLATEFTIPEVKRIVNNELAMIAESHRRYRDTREVDAYMRDEVLSAANVFGGLYK